MKRLMIIWFLFLPLGLARAQLAPAPEASVKAVFIYNFTRFVDWPEEAFTSASAPFIIGVTGEEPLGPALLAAVAGEMVGNHPIKVHTLMAGTKLKECHLLYMSTKDTERATQLLGMLGQQPILTVGEAEAFCRQGGMIRFLTRNNKIRLEINPAAVRAGGLGISSKLLQVADRVN
jgi:hypothetical protein